MALFLVNPENQMLVLLDAPPGILVAIQEQWQRLSDEGDLTQFTQRLSKRLVPVIADTLDWDLRPPTEAQVTYAVSVARRLSLEIPSEVLQRRSAMGTFLDTHGDPLRSKRRVRSAR